MLRPSWAFSAAPNLSFLLNRLKSNENVWLKGYCTKFDMATVFKIRDGKLLGVIHKKHIGAEYIGNSLIY